MKLSKVEITNFRCFEHLTVPLQEDVNVFVGVNGAGKSTLLDAIAIALYDIVAANSPVRFNQRKTNKTELYASDLRLPLSPKLLAITIKAQADKFQPLPPEFPADKAIEWSNSVQHTPPAGFKYPSSNDRTLKNIYAYCRALASLAIKEPKALIELPVVAYYRSTRNLPRHPETRKTDAMDIGLSVAYKRALDASGDYDEMFAWFERREAQELRQQRENPQAKPFDDLKSLQNALQKIEGIQRAFISSATNSLCVELLKHNGSTETLDVSQLSDGYRNLLALIADFARRLAIAHPNWENPLTAPGILLIDEIELHLHPHWQQRIIPNLRAAFPNTQLIVTTHSPQVLTTVESRNIAIVRDLKLYAPSIGTYGAESKRVTQEVLDTESRPPDNENTDRIRQLFTLINQDKLSEAFELSAELMKTMGSDEPALIEAQMIIKNREWEKELGV